MAQMGSLGKEAGVSQFTQSKARWAQGSAANGGTMSSKVSSKGHVDTAGSDYEVISAPAARGTSYQQRALGALSQQASADQQHGGALLMSET